MKFSLILKPPFLIGLALLVSIAGCNKVEKSSYQGYIEGEYVYLAAPSAGYLDKLLMLRGSRVTEGTHVFSLAADPEQHGLREAEAREQSAREKLRNLSEPHRQPEVAAMEAQVHMAEVALTLSERQLQQREALAEKGFISPASLDEIRATHDRDKAQLDAARQQLATYQTTLGRKPEMRAAAADVDVSNAQVAQQHWQVDKKTVSAPAAGEITETYYRPGEWVQAGQPVVSLLPDNRRIIRFFVPEPVVASIRLGGNVEVTCDGCPTAIRGTINFIAPQAEYTPPVIYSRGSREKMVFRIEAVPRPEQALALKPGLPIDVSFTEH